MKENMEKMKAVNDKINIPEEEIDFSYSRSSGPGGQNVNKRDTKVTLSWNVDRSRVLSEEQKVIIRRRLARYITKEGNIVLYDQESRYQEVNKERVMNKLNEMISQTLRRKKKRIPTKPSKKSEERRLEEKRKQSRKKELRKPPKILE